MNDITLPAYGIVIIFFFLLYPYIKNTPQNVRSQKFPKISNTPQNVRFQKFLIFDSSLIVFCFTLCFVVFHYFDLFLPQKTNSAFFFFFQLFYIPFITALMVNFCCHQRRAIQALLSLFYFPPIEITRGMDVILRVD
jgi:hypothetical protein